MPDREDLDDEYFRQFETLLKDLRSFTVSNFEHFKAYDDVNSLRFVKSCSFIMEHIDHGVLPGVEYVIRIARFYDFSELHPGNGFRSLVKLVEKCCLHLLTLMRFITSNRKSLIFRGDYYSRELESYAQMLGQLRACLYYSEKYVSCSSGCELITEAINEEQYEIMGELDNLSLEPFYGTCLGFQLSPSLRQPLMVMHIILASYSESYNKSSPLLKFASTLVNSGKFITSSEFRAKKVIDATLEGDVAFCKSFWSLSENVLIQNLQKVVCPQVAVNKVFEIPPDPVRVPLADNTDRGITVLPSGCHGNASPVMVRLLSYVARKGQVPSHTHPPSDCLMVHVHGGGFVAQSSASHSLYLRHWAKDLNLPIFSIDYSLAPEFPYPRQVEEIFFAYCWALNNLSALGTTGKRICLVGDSAGANLAVSTALRAIHRGVRVPDGVLSIYGSFLVRYAPSPSRLMAILDPILPLGLLIKCLSAYIGMSTDSHKRGEEGEKKSTVPEVVGSRPASVEPDQVQIKEGMPADGPLETVDPDLLLESEEEGSEVISEGGGGGGVQKSSSEGDVKARWKFLDLKRKITERKRHSLWKLQVGPRNYPGADEEEEEGRKETAKSEPALFDLKSRSQSPLPPSLSSQGRKLRDGKKKGTFDPPEYALYRTSPPPCYKRVRAATERNTDPFLSPVFASSALLSRLCPTYFVACHFDPLLDESVHLAKRIRSSGGRACLDLVDDLPHGFLNFIHLSREAEVASSLCVARMKEIFGPEEEEPETKDEGRDGVPLVPTLVLPGAEGVAA